MADNKIHIFRNIHDGCPVANAVLADRVFESRLDDLQHFGTENYYDDYVPDGFKEIWRK